MTATAIVHGPSDLNEPDRATVRGGNIVVDVIANDDGSVTIETYPYEHPADKRVAVTIEEERLTSTGNVINLIITDQ